MRLLLSILLMLFLVPPWMGAPRRPLLGRHPNIATERVALDPANPARRRLGQLDFLGGVRLTSRDPTFGGFSSLLVSGDRFTLLSDGGNIVRFRMDAMGRVSDPYFGDLPDGPGRGWDKKDRDSESLVRDSDGSLLVGFETSNQIWRYSPDFARALGHVAPPAMARWPENKGAEAMALLDDSLVVIDEDGSWRHARGRAAVRFTRDPIRAPDRGYRFAFQSPKGLDPSDMAVLPDGRLLVLNRRFALPFDFSVALTIVDPRAIRPGALVQGREIARLAAPLVHDNFEGVAVTQEKGATIIWLVSDDNQFILQRTFLLKFRLLPDSPERVRR